MDKKIKIIGLLLGIVYLFIIGEGFYRIISKSIEKQGEFYPVVVKKDKDTARSFTPVVNISNAEFAGVEYSKIKVYIEKEHKDGHSYSTLFAAITTLVLAFTTIGLVIFIPFKTFQVITSISREKLFDVKNIARIRKVAYALFLTYITGFLYSIFNRFTMVEVLQVEGYSIEYDRPSILILFLGLVVLLFAELLKASIQMKEEQDLTV